jgi:hypothetical protein
VIKLECEHIPVMKSKPTIIWSGSVHRKMGWYIVYNWTSDNEIYKHGPFDTIEEAKAYAIKKKINV